METALKSKPLDKRPFAYSKLDSEIKLLLFCVIFAGIIFLTMGKMAPVPFKRNENDK